MLALLKHPFMDSFLRDEMEKRSLNENQQETYMSTIYEFLAYSESNPAMTEGEIQDYINHTIWSADNREDAKNALRMFFRVILRGRFPAR